MKTPYATNAVIFGLVMLTILLFLGHTLLFLTKGIQPWYYDWFPSPTEQIIAFLTVPVGLVTALGVKKIFQ